MKIHLITATPEFENDLCDVLRLFYGDFDLAEDGAEKTFLHTASEENGFWLDSWSCEGQEKRTETPICTGHPIEIKRVRKRCVKDGLYRLLKEMTGLKLPWGALTGIRPTRLLYEGMDSGLNREEAKRRLTEVFDVSPDRADLLSRIADMQQGILHPQKDEFDLYIGIPFCATRCSYCSFASGEIGNGRLVEPYVSALEHEIAECGRMMQEKGLRLRAGYIGGGTPTAIPASALARVLDAAQAAFPNAKEWTVEAGRPDTIDREKLAMLLSRKVDRISVNPQTFCDETLRRVGRAHTGEDTVRAYLLAREMGFDDINMDLIAALPGETPQIFEQSIEKVIALNPDSVTVHALAIKRSSRLHEQLHVQNGAHGQVSAAGAQEMIDFARKTLTEAGWNPYYLYRQKYMAGNLENVGYAKKGKACLYNIGNMEETASVLALGAGAISKWLFNQDEQAVLSGYDPELLRFSNIQLRIERAANVRNIEQYIERTDEMIRRKREMIFPEDRL